MANSKQNLLVNVTVVSASVLITLVIQYAYPALAGFVARTESSMKDTKALRAHHNELLTRAGYPTLGSATASLTIVEFFDYRCPSCRAAAREVERFLRSYPQICIVLRDYPILGEDSEYAARMAIAAGQHGKYLDFYHAMFLRDEAITRTAVDHAISAIGLDLAAVKRESREPAVEAILSRSRTLADEIKIQGTPWFVIGGVVVRGGAISEEDIKQALAKLARTTSHAANEDQAIESL